MEKDKKENLFFIAISGVGFLGIFVLIIETISYTFSFLASGLLKADLFNLIEKRNVVLGIHSIKVLIILNVVIPLLINLVKQINTGFVAKIESRIRRNVKSNLLEKIIYRKMGQPEAKGEGEYMSLFRNETEDIASYFITFYYQLPKIVLSIAILIVMFYVNPVFTVVSLIPTVLMLLLIKYLGKYIVRYRNEARESTSDLTGYMENVFNNIEFFKLISDPGRVFMEFHDKCKKRSKNEVKDRVLDKILGVVSENSSDLVLGFVLLIAIPLFKSGQFSIGEFVMFEYYYAFLASLPNAVGTILKQYKQTKVSVDRLQNAGHDSVQYHGRALQRGDELEIEVITSEKTFSVKARKGEIVLIQSESESARSVVLRRMFQVLVQELSRINGKYVPASPMLFDASIKENICMGEAYDPKKMTRVLKQTDLIEDLSAFDNGIEKNVGKRGAAVSGGQKKRIGIARALYLDAEILFVDGLTEQVDSRTEDILIANILKDFKGIVFVASNSKRIGEMADRKVCCE